MNIWIALLIGVIIGLLLGMGFMWLLVKEKIMNKSIEIRKNKQKGGPGNVQDIEAEFNEAEGTSRKENRQQRKEENKAEREARREEKKLKRSINNLKSNS